MPAGPKRRRWPKWLLWGLVVAVAFAATAVVGVELALKTRPVRAALAGRLTVALEESYKIRVELDDFSLSLLSGSLEVRDLVLRAGDGDPFARVESVRAEWRALSLLTGRLKVQELAVEHPEVDLRSPLPKLPESAEEDSPAELPVTIDRARLTGGSVVGPSPAGLSDHLELWRISDLSVDGSLEGNRFAVEPLTAVVDVALSDLDDASFDLEARVRGRLDGPVEIDAARLSGEHLEAHVSGRFGNDENDIQLDFTAETDPGFWLGQPSETRIAAEGAVDLSTWRGGLRVQGPDLPGTLFTVFVEQSLADQLELASTSFDLAADLTLVGDGGVEGDVRLTGDRGPSQIFEVVGSPRIPGGLLEGDQLPFAMGLEADLLPDGKSARSIDVTVIGDVRRPDDWRLEGGVLELEAPQVDRLLAEVASLWPRLLPRSALAGVPPLGSMVVKGDFSGALNDPEVDVALDWAPHPGSEIEAAFSGRPIRGDSRLRMQGSDLDLRHFTGSMGGRLGLSGDLTGTFSNFRGAVEVVVQNLEAAGEAGSGEPLFEILEVRAEGDEGRISWTFDGRAAAIGVLEGTGFLVPAPELAAAEGTLNLLPGEGSRVAETLHLERLETEFKLAGGALDVKALGLLAGREPLSIEAQLPLDALARLPGAETLATLPVRRSDGSLDISWDIPTGDWASLISSGAGGPVNRLEAGSSGRIELDTECPACSRALGAVVGFAAEMEGRSLAADEPLNLLLGDGALRLGPWAVRGEELSLSIDATAALDEAWRFGFEPSKIATSLAFSAEGDVGSSWLEALLPDEGGLDVVTPGIASLRASGSWGEEGWRGEATFAADDLELGSKALPGLPLASPRADVRLADDEIRIERLTCRVGDGELSAEGRLRLDDPLGRGQGILQLVGSLPVLDGLELPFEIREGLLSVAEGRLTTPGGSGYLRFQAPLDARAGRRASVAWETPSVDWSPLLTFFTGQEDPERLMLSSRGEGSVDLDRPTEARLSATIPEASITVRGRSTMLQGPASLTLEDGSLSLPSFSLVSGPEIFDFEGSGELARAWKPGDPLSEILARFEVNGQGALDSGLLNPFLSGGRAEGALGIDMRLAGSPSDYTGSVRIGGTAASILYRSPYLTRISRPDIELAIAGGRITLERGTAVLNEGSLRLAGVLSDEGRSDLQIGLDDALFRLDYGLLTTLDGDLRYRAEPDGTALVSGTVGVERGSLTRDVQLDLDLLSQLLAPIDLTTTEDDPLDLIALELDIRTREGVRVKNNLGDLLVRWEPLTVTGSVAKPIIEGELNVDPGGLLYAYGQTVRLDRATIEYPGEEGVEPRLDFEATTSLEDPTIGRLAGEDPFRTATPSDDASGPASGQFTADLARYYGEQFAGRVGESVGVKVSLRPLLIFGEADPGARLTVSRDLSTNLAIAASVDLRQAEGQTYLLELHELRGLPRLVAQAFTDDASDYGGALLQRQEFGGARKKSISELPHVSKLVVEPPVGVSRRGIRRALALEKGDRFDLRQRFVAEVELVDYLMLKGYPDARVSVTPVADGRREQKVRLELDIQEGPRVSFRFEGEEIAKPLRRIIRSLYRPDFFEPESIEEMRAETVRALRSRGFLEPAVAISVEPVDPSAPEGDRTVTVRTTGGVKMSPDPPVFLGIPDSDAEALNLAFANAVQRVELAVGMPSADRRLQRALADLGYPQASIINRYQSLDTRVLTVEIEPGPRQHIALIEIEGATEEGLPGVSVADLRARLVVAEGDPLLRNRVSRSAIALERELASRGYLGARVRPVLGPAEGEDQWAKAVTFVVEPGTQSRLSEVEFTGLRSTRESWARKVTGLESGAPLARDDLSRARTNLWRTGLFSGVSAETVESEPGHKRVVFDLAERDRYRLTYGVRWDSEDGLGAVVDATDDNFTGRAWTLGLRALYSNDEKSLRWLTRVPRAFGGPGSLEVFAAIRDLATTVFLGPVFGTVDVPIERLEGTLQYSHPLSPKSTARTYLRYTDEDQTFPFFSVRIRNPQLGLQYVYDSRGPEPLTERGVFASIDLSGSRQFLGGDLRYVRMFSQFNLYRPAGRILGKKLLWSQSLRLGLTETFDQELINSRDVRFFAGGEYSVRGYETESLGPQGFGGPAGGGALFVVNQELRWRVLRDYSLVLFADAGNVWEMRDELSLDLFTSAGLGLRALTPVGLLRLDIAHPLDGRVGIDPDYKVYFGIGTTF